MARPIDDERHTHQRTLLLSAAYRRFAAEGFERTSTASICEAAGMSSGTLFHYFPTKLDILVSLLDANARSIEAALDRLTASTHGLVAVMGALAEFEHRADADLSSDFHRAALGAAHHPEVAAILDTITRRVAAFLRTHLRAAADERRIRTDVRADQLAVWVHWSIDGAMLSRAEQRRTPGELARAVTALLQP